MHSYLELLSLVVEIVTKLASLINFPYTCKNYRYRFKYQGTHLFVLPCHRLLAGVHIYTYISSHANSCLQQYKLLLAQQVARDCLR